LFTQESKLTIMKFYGILIKTGMSEFTDITVSGRTFTLRPPSTTAGDRSWQLKKGESTNHVISCFRAKDYISALERALRDIQKHITSENPK
jgi:hypothetical protein